MKDEPKKRRGGKPRANKRNRGINTKVKPFVDKSVSLFAYKRG